MCARGRIRVIARERVGASEGVWGRGYLCLLTNGQTHDVTSNTRGANIHVQLEVIVPCDMVIDQESELVVDQEGVIDQEWVSQW